VEVIMRSRFRFVVIVGVAAMTVWLLTGAAGDGAKPGAYIGAAACVCHADPEQSTWHKTKHAQAFELLKLAGQEKNEKCLPCHTTGYGRGGYGTPGVTVNLEGVQCEECHGPGGDHAATMDKTKITRTPAVTVCARCHQDLDIHGTG
jgi:hypothetical protein